MAESDDRERDSPDFDSVMADHADVRAAYRSASVGDEPGNALDAAILAASRKAVNAGPASVDRAGRFLRRLTVPLSAAAVMVLATSLSFLVYEERGTPSAPESSRAVPAPVRDSTTEGQLDLRVPGPPSATPPGVAGEPPSKAAKTDVAAATPARRMAPESRRVEPARSTPDMPAVAAPSPPSEATAPEPAAPAVGPPSEADEVAMREQTRTAREQRAAAAASRAAGALSERSAGTIDERAAAQEDLLESVHRWEAARADTQGDDAGRANLHLRALPRTVDSEAASGGTAPRPRASTATEPSSVAAARRPASPAQADVPQEASARVQRALPVPGAEETPDEWIARVRALVGAGRIDAARAEVVRLRCRYPDVKLPADLPAPDKTVACRAVAPKEAMPDLR